MRPPIIHDHQVSAEQTVKFDRSPSNSKVATPASHSALGSVTLPLPQTGRFPQIRGYEILSVVGAGGMGIIYEARHIELNRRVAIKTLRGEALADLSFRDRFRAEAEAIAKLQHPHVIQVFEVGNVDPQPGERDSSPFLALEFVDGGSLTQRTRTPQSPQFAAKTLETLARAAHAAHRLGIIHRDLKPANVLLTGEGLPKIADFGIAKQLDTEQCPASPALTRTGTIMGTPEYMAPEQLEGEPASPSIDIYSLGVILYELLTGRVPLQGATFIDTMRLALREEPVPPRRLQPNVPRDLETICLKCLEKAPARRYESAEALADDLARWLAGRPIQARPLSTTERTARWARRNPAVAVLSMSVLLVAFTGLTGIVWGWREAHTNSLKAHNNAERAEDEAKKALKAAAKERWERYRVSVLAASSALRLADSNAASRALADAPEEYRDWVWRLQHAQLDRAQYILGDSNEPLYAVYYTPDGHWAFGCGNDRSIHVWDLIARKKFDVVPGTAKAILGALSDDGRTVAYTRADNAIVLCNVATGDTQHILRGHTGRIEMIWFASDNKRLVTSAIDRTARVWDVVTGQQTQAFQAPKGVSMPLVLSPDCRFVASRWNDNGIACLWDMQTGREVVSFPGHEARVMSLKFNRQGNRLATMQMFPDNTLRVWDIPSGKLIATMRGHENQVSYVDFNADATRLVSCSMDRTVRLWDITPAADPRNIPPLFTLRGHAGWVHHAAFSPDGKRLVSAAHDRTVRYWNTHTGEERAVLCGHTKEVWSTSFRADGKMIASAHNGEIRLWNVGEVERDYAIRGHKSFVYGVAFHPDGERVASASWDGTARIWNATTGKEIFRFEHGEKIVVASVAFDPKGQFLATLARDKSLRLWDANTGKLVHRWSVPSENWRDSRVTFSPNSDLIACGSHDGNIYLWDVNTREQFAILGRHADGVRDVAFSPDGRWLASGGENSDRAIRIWDVAAKKEVKVIYSHSETVYSVAWNPTGTMLASGSVDGTVRLWNTATWENMGVLKLGTNIYDVVFSHDGKLLAAACSDNLIRVWHVETQQEIAELSGHREYVHSLVFSPDGTRLVSGSGDRTLRVWDTLTPIERAKRLALPKNPQTEK